MESSTWDCIEFRCKSRTLFNFQGATATAALTRAIVMHKRSKKSAGISPTVKSLNAAVHADFMVLKEQSAGLKKVAIAFEKSVPWASGVVNGAKPFPLTMLNTWVELTGGMNFARWVADMVDCDLAPRSQESLDVVVVKVVHETSGAIQIAAGAVGDGVISRDEIAQYEQQKAEAIESLHHLGHTLKGKHARSKGPTRKSLAEYEKSR